MVAWDYWGLIMAKTFSLGLYVISANIDWDCVKLGKVLFVLLIFTLMVLPSGLPIIFS